MGESLVQPALGATLEALADTGPRALYGGELGTSIARHLHALGSAMAPGDLAAHEPQIGPPLTLGYRDLEVNVVPPNSQGFVLLQILALVERLRLDPDPVGPDVGALAEVFRVTAAERDRANADPRRVDVPVGLLLSDAHLAELADAVRRREGAPPPERRTDTIALVAADASGLGVALIQSLYDPFGSGILEPSTGVLLHCRGAAFVLEPGHPNVLEGGKRPSHTLLPVVVRREGRLVALAGTMGGGGQPQIDAMSLLRAFDLGLGAADAVAAPRWLVGGMALGRTERRVVAEASVPAVARRWLEDAGYGVDVVGDLGRSVGHAHLLLVREDGGFDVGSDPRADGGVAVR
jgi:gamma-glutamyltranspeptidase/glutathione hydrolase